MGEEFGLKPGTLVTGKMVTALRELGFDYVFDTDFAADLTIMEEASEFVHRLKHGGTLPILTSCCPAWINMLEHDYPDMLDIPSTCKSPHQMMGIMTKTYFAEKMNIDPKKIVVVPPDFLKAAVIFVLNNQYFLENIKGIKILNRIYNNLDKFARWW